MQEGRRDREGGTGREGHGWGTGWRRDRQGNLPQGQPLFFMDLTKILIKIQAFNTGKAGLRLSICLWVSTVPLSRPAGNRHVYLLWRMCPWTRLLCVVSGKHVSSRHRVGWKPTFHMIGIANTICARSWCLENMFIKRTYKRIRGCFIFQASKVVFSQMISSGLAWEV